MWGIEPDEIPDAGIPATALLAELGGPVKTLLVAGSNVVVSAPDVDALRERLQALDTLIVWDFFLSETAELADIVLPVLQWAEEEGTMTSLEGRVIRRRQALPGPEGARSELWIMSELARRLGAASTWSVDRPRCSTSSPARRRVGSPITPASRTPCSTRGSRRTGRTAPRARRGPSPSVSRTPTAARVSCRWMPLPGAHDRGGDLTLTTGRYLQQYQSGTQTRRVAELNGARPRGAVEIHPATASRLGIREDALVSVSNERGEVRARATVTTDIRHDTVFLPFHYAGGECANRLTEAIVDRPRHARVQAHAGSSEGDSGCHDPTTHHATASPVVVAEHPGVAPALVGAVGGAAPGVLITSAPSPSSLSPSTRRRARRRRPMSERVGAGGLRSRRGEVDRGGSCPPCARGGSTSPSSAPNRMTFITACCSPNMAVGRMNREGLDLGDRRVAEDAGVRFVLGTTVVGVDRDLRVVRLHDGIRIPYDRLVLATGARANVPTLAGLERAQRHRSTRPALPSELDHGAAALPRGVVALRDLADAEHVRAAVSAGQRIVVLGAGVLGMELALAAAEAGAEVVVAYHSAAPMNRTLDENGGRVLAAAASAVGIEMMHHARAESIVQRYDDHGQAWFDGLVCADGKVLGWTCSCCRAGSGHGRRSPRSRVSPPRPGVLVDGSSRSWTDPNVFAIGDCAHVADPADTGPDGRVPGGPSGLIGPGWRQADRLAALLSSGVEAPHRSSAPVS